MPSDSHRLTILTAEEVEDLFGFPRFTDEDRHLYFDLSKPERAAVDAYTVPVATHLILQLGYFKAKWQFFYDEQNNASEDLRYILARYFPERKRHP